MFLCFKEPYGRRFVPIHKLELKNEYYIFVTLSSRAPIHLMLNLSDPYLIFFFFSSPGRIVPERPALPLKGEVEVARKLEFNNSSNFRKNTSIQETQERNSKIDIF